MCEEEKGYVSICREEEKRGQELVPRVQSVN